MIWTEHRLVPIFDAHGTVTAVEGIARDVTELKLKEAFLTHRALHDPLTGLPNRVLLLDRLETALARIRRHESLSRGALPRPRPLQDGERQPRPRDRRPAARRSSRSGCRRRCARPTAWPASVATSSPPSSPTSTTGSEATQVAERLLAVVAEPVDLGEGELVITVSIGIAGAGDGTTSAAELLRRADFAMYTAKDRGRARVESYDALDPDGRTGGRRRVDRQLASADGLRPAAVPARPARARARGRGRGARRHGRRVGGHAGRPDAAGRGARAGRRRGRRHRLPRHHRQPGPARGRRGLDRPPVRVPGHARRGASRASAPRSWWRRCRGSCPCATRRATPCSTRPPRTPPTRWARCSRACGRCRCRVDDGWHLDLAGVDPADAERALVLWLQRPEQPHRGGGVARADASRRSSGRGSGGSSSPATSATPSSPTTTPARRPRPVTALAAGSATACSRCTRCRSDRTWPGCGPGSSPATASSSATSVRCGSTAA